MATDTVARHQVVPINKEEIVVVFKVGEGADAELKNVTIKDSALVAEYLQHRADEARVTGAAQAEIEAAGKDFSESAKALELKYQSDAKALAASREARIAVAQKQLESAGSVVVAARAKTDKKAFAAAEGALAKQAK
jgi:lipid A disaccharide synthetase